MSEIKHFGHDIRDFLLGLLEDPAAQTPAPAPSPSEPTDQDRPVPTDIYEQLSANLRILAERLAELRPGSREDYARQLRNPLASRLLGVWIQVDIPLLGKTMIFDSRVDNPLGISKELASLPSGKRSDPWPAPPVRHNKTGMIQKGHAGSSCPGYLSKAIRNASTGQIEIPVEVLAFHAEGHNGEVAYSIRMHSEVTGRLDAPPTPGEDSFLSMWGRMVIAIKPDNPADFGGYPLIELVSKDYIEQRGRMTGFPPKLAGEFIESKGDEEYVGLSEDQAHLSAIVRRGRIIFSTEVDEFLQARTRIHTFVLLDRQGRDLDVSDPYDPSLVGRIGGVRIVWDEVIDSQNGVTHYRLYRMDPDDPTRTTKVLGDRLTSNEYVDTEYDGSRALAYAVVPCMVDNAGIEVQGVSLDYAEVSHVKPHDGHFRKANHGVGHLRKML